MSNNLMTLVSIGLTPMTILSAFAVVYLWFGPFCKTLKDKERTAVGWMIIGVVINFSGAIMDNIWWHFAWSADYINHESDMKKFFFDNGVYSNTFFRQITGILGALCHIHSGFVTQKRWLKGVVFGGAVLGIGWVMLLINITVNK